jgi:uncharacterized protein
MNFPSFIDANIPIYAAGGPHSLRDPSRAVIRLASGSPAAFVTDAEVLQELLHRYRAVNRWAEGRQVFLTFARILQGSIEPIHAEDVQRAASMADAYGMLSSRDLLHLAVMERLGVTRIISADRGFDRVAHIERLDPADFDSWRDSLAL